MLGTTTQTTRVHSSARHTRIHPTEIGQAGTTEIWEIYNLTGDTHPIHFHLVNVQILGRAPSTRYNAACSRPTSAFSAPEPNEGGWKETVRVNPGEVTRVIMKFDLPALPTIHGSR